MRATKFKIKIEIETLSMDAASGLMLDIIKQIESEVVGGEQLHDDGDSFKWRTERTEVEF